MNPLRFLLPEQHSTVASEVDNLYYYITWVSIFFFVLIVVLMVWFVFKYRRRDPSEPPGQGDTHNTPLEITWSVIPLILVIIMFYYGMKGYVTLMTPPENCYAIDVVGKQWAWEFNYPNGLSHEELHGWAEQPLRLRCTSRDVIHAVHIPEFRIKTDVVPGKFSNVWFEAKDLGTGEDAHYTMFCAEFCGDDHSKMFTKVVIHPTEEAFRAWLKGADKRPDGMSPVEYGRKLWNAKGCKQCHSIDGTPGNGPTWAETGRLYVAGADRILADGKKAKVDDEYLRESILNPNAKTVQGYQFGLMTRQNLTMDQITDIIEFIESLATEAGGK